MARKSLIGMIKSAKTEDIAEKFKNDFIYTVENNNEDHPSSRTLSPSSLNCARQMSCKLLGISKEDGKEAYSMSYICDIGSAIHEITQRHCLSLNKFKYISVADYVRDKKLDLEIGQESDFEKGIYETHLYKLDKDGNKIVSFLVDGILQDKETGKYMILEIKSCGGSGFFKMDSFMEKHKNQGIAYSILLDIPTVLYLYICRDVPTVKPFIFKPSKEDKQNLLDKCHDVLEKSKENIIVAKPQDVSKTTCSYCSYRKFCNKIGEGEYQHDSAI